MAVQVDDVRHSFGRMVMCHLWADFFLNRGTQHCYLDLKEGCLETTLRI